MVRLRINNTYCILEQNIPTTLLVLNCGCKYAIGVISLCVILKIYIWIYREYWKVVIIKGKFNQIRQRWRAHCFFTIMNIKRKGTFQFCFPGLIGIHRNTNWFFLKCCESFLRKSSVCGFDRPWDMFWIFSGYDTFIMFQKNFRPKDFFWNIILVANYDKNVF